MEKTLQKICEYEEAKEAAKVCGCWGDERFSFGDFIGHPTEYTTEKFEFHLECARQLDLNDHMQSSLQEEEEYPSDSSVDNEDVE